MLVSYERPTGFSLGPGQDGGWSDITIDGMLSALEERPALLSGDTVCEAVRALQLPKAGGGFKDHAEFHVGFQFADFELQPRFRMPLYHGCPVDIGGRAFDMLHVLLRARGRLVTKAEIVSHVWPGVFVDEINLRVQIFYLRKALGKDRDLVKNVPGRGYFLATHISCGPTRAVAPAEELQHRPARQKTLVEPAGLVAGPCWQTPLSRQPTHWTPRDTS